MSRNSTFYRGLETIPGMKGKTEFLKNGASSEQEK